MTWDVWGPPVIVLLLGLIGGLIIALRLKSGAPRADDREALLAHKQALMERLRNLDGAAHLESEAERERLITEAAQIARELDTSAPAAAPANAAGRPLNVTTLIGAVVLFIVLGIGLSQFSTPRQDMGGQGMGAQPASSQDASAITEVSAAQATLSSNPTDLWALNTLTYDALMRRDFQSAMTLLDRSRAVDPQDTDVQIHLSILRMTVSMMDPAAATLDSVIAAAPNNGKAQLWRAVVHFNQGNVEAGQEGAREAIAAGLSPAEDSLARSLLVAPSAQTAKGTTESAPAESLAAVSGPARVSGTITLADGAAVPPGATLFIYARRDDSGRGPPAAAQKHAGVTLPFTFSLSEGDMVMGGSGWPEQVWIQARLDADGNAMTREDADVASAVIGPVQSGSEGLEVSLGG